MNEWIYSDESESEKESKNTLKLCEDIIPKKKINGESKKGLAQCIATISF